MKRVSLCFTLVVVGLLIFGMSHAWAGSGTVTVHFLKSDNATGVAGGIVQYYKSGWQTLGTTDGSGTASGPVTLTGNSTNFQMFWYGGTASWTNVDVTTNPTLTANTTPVTVKLQTCAGGVLAGRATWNAGSAWGGWNVIGITPAGTELLPGSYAFGVNYSAYNGANASFGNTKNQDISVNPVVLFNTTKVSLLGPNIKYYENSPTSGWVSFVNPSEMLPGTVSSFSFNGVPYTLTISGCSFSAAFFTAYLKDSHNNGLPGGVVTYYKSGWQTFGTTGANGSVSGLVMGVSKTDFAVKYNGMRQATSNNAIDLNVTSSKTWWTTPVVVKLQTCGDVDLAAPASAYYGGSLGNTPTTAFEMLGGTNTFYVKYGTRQGVIPNTLVTVATGPGTPTVVEMFHTTLVTYPANTYYYQNAPVSGFALFPGSQEMIAGPLDIKLGSPSAATVHDIIPAYPTCTWDPYAVPKIGEQGDGITELPTAFGLSQNYPNPFNPSTSIRVSVPVDATVSLAVYNTLGQKVAELMGGVVSAGHHDVQFDATNLSSGLYIYRMVAKGNDGKDFTNVQKMLLMK